MGRESVLSVSAVLVAMMMAVGSPAAGDDAYLIAHMDGANERPGPGDLDAFGRATITIETRPTAPA